MTLNGQLMVANAAVKARAPQKQPARNTGSMTDYLPPFGTNPPSGPVTKADADLSERVITNDPRDSWYLSLPSKLNPKQVLQILRSALGGDLWQQFMLLQLMLDTWPMFAKCCYELRSAVSQTNFEVKPYVEAGLEPSKTATEKAALVTRAMRSFQPNPFSDEKEFTGMVYHLTDPILSGMAMEEITWTQPQRRAGGGWERLPRAAAFVHPRHFTFSNDGNVVVFDDNYSRLYWDLAKQQQSPDPDKFICGQFSRSGGALGAGFMRPLAWYWSAMVFNKEWMLNFAQRYGNPFLDLTYKPGTPKAEIDALEAFAARAGSQNFIVHPEGTTLVTTPPQTLGRDNPQARITNEANEQCQLLLLGQTATSTPTPGKLGNDEQHGKVRREFVEMLAGWTCTNPLKQFARMIVRVNYGDETEVPDFVPDFTEAANPQAVAQTWQTRMQSRLPFDAEEYYKENNCKQPEPGDLVVVDGLLGRMGAIDKVIEVGPQPLPEPGQGGDGFNAAVAAATPKELDELHALVKAAHAAPHANGELAAVKTMVERINCRTNRRNGRRN